MTDTGSTAWTLPTANVNNIDYVEVQNVNTGSAAATTEVATVTFSALNAGATLTIAGRTVTAGASGATAADVAAAFRSGTTSAVGGATPSGTLTGYTSSAVQGGLGNVLTLTATTAGAQADISATGTAVTGSPQITTLTQSGAITADDKYTFTVNGREITTVPVGATTLAAASAKIAAAINAFVGSTVAVVGGTNDVNVVVTSSTPISISSPVNSVSKVISASALTQSIVVATPPLVSITQGADAVTVNDTVNADNFTGTLQLITVMSTGGLVVNNLSGSQSVGMKEGNGNLTANYKAAATTATLNVTDGNVAGTAKFTGTGLTSVTVNSAGGAQAATAGQINTITGLDLGSVTNANTVNINAATSLTIGTGAITGGSLLKTINASGAATRVDLGVLNNVITKVDGSGLTAGGIKATLGTAITSFTGGAGADEIKTAITTAAGAVISGGGGPADILVLASTNDVSTAAKAAQYTGFEILRTEKANAVVDMANFGSGYTAVQTNANGASFVNMTAGQAANVRVLTTNGSPTFGLANSAGTSDVLSLTLQNLLASNASTAISVTGMTANGFETLNVFQAQVLKM